MIGKMLVFVLCLILLISISMQLLLISMTVFRRIAFDAICHRYVRIMDLAGGLTEAAAGQMIQELEDHGFHVVEWHATESGVYGVNMNFSVRVINFGKRLTPLLSLEDDNQWFTYEAHVACRVIKTFATDP